MVNLRKILAVFLLLTMVAGMFSGCNAEESKRLRSTPEDFADAKIGVFTGASFDNLAKEHYPQAERLYFRNLTDMILNLQQEKIDGILIDEAFFIPQTWDDDTLSSIEMDMPATEYAVAFPQTQEGEALKRQIDEFIHSSTENGWLAELEEKWFSTSEPDGYVDLSLLTGENGTLRVAATAETKPFDYLKNGQVCGYDVDFLFRFAMEYGYALDIETMDFGALFPSLAAGRHDLAVSGLTITEERKESVLFSDVYYRSPVVMVVNEQIETAPAEIRRTLADLSTAKIGVITGSAHDGTISEVLPDAKRVYFNNMADMILAVEQGKIDGYMEDAPFVAPLIWEGVPLTTLEETVGQMSNGFVFPQGTQSEALRLQVDAFLAEAKADGTVERLCQKWMGETEPMDVPDYAALSGENGTIRLAISVDNKPMLYQRGNSYTGFEMELLTLFGQKAGYAFEIEVVPFESIVAGIAAGKYDMGASSLNITPEREESVDFSDPYAAFDVVMVTRNTIGQRTDKTLADFENAKIGVHTGTVYDDYAKERFPNAPRVYFNQISDMIVAVEQGKIDGYLSESTYVTAAIWEGAEVEALAETLDNTHAGYIFPKGEQSAQLRQQLDAFIREAKENGIVDNLMKKWTGKTEPTETPDYKSLTGENGTLEVAVAPDLKPVTYIQNGEPTGYEIELLTLFAKEYGYKLDMSYMTFDAILPGVTTGRYDIGTGAVTITEERAQSVDFSESHLTVDVVMVVSAKETETVVQTGFWNDVKESFEKTFIREDRWKLIVEGIGVTMLISSCATILGTLLGFGLYMLSRSDVKLIRKLTKSVAKVYSRIIAGTPVVVILMILFYVIFGKIRDMSGVVVAIIGFTLTFGAFVYDHMTVSVGSVDRGQTEAAYALGYNKNQTFFRIIFPQAMSIFLPSYCGQAVETIKATAVVGYVAVNDLTKMGDIIRSNTYEAFFPLIATAVIYFLLTWMLSALLGLVKRSFEPKRRSKEDILKGVKTV